jgi:hypothetical protein
VRIGASAERRACWLRHFSLFTLHFSLFTLFFNAAVAVGSGLNDHIAERRTVDDKFAAELEALAVRCDELGMAGQAAATRAWRLPPPHGRTRIFLPQESPVANAENDEPTDNDGRWRRKFLAVRREHAAALVDLSRKAIEDGDVAVGYQWLHEALREDPHQPLARQALDFRQVEGRWRRAGAPIRVQTARSAHPHFDFSPGKYWRIDSAHFRITTDHSPEAGQELAALLEEFYDVWRQLFVEYWTSGEALLARFERASPVSRGRKKFRVTLFRDREGYVTSLKSQQPLIDKTVGIYFDKQQESFFYFDGPDRATWRHETAHQLFQETGSHPLGAGDDANFWAVEGAALYMESAVTHDGVVTLGGYDADRLQFARLRALGEKFYVPIEDFVRLGKDDVQRDPNLPKLYSQAAGLAHYLIDGEGGAHRQRFARYLKAIYEKRADAGAMAAIWGDDFARLNAGYAAFLNVTDEDLAASPPDRSIRNLCLARTPVTDRGLERLGDCQSLQWLDLSDTAIGDAGVESLVRLAGLRRLWLTNTHVTSAALERLAALESLEELHIGGLPVDASAVRRLQQALPKLELIR